ncbi:MAG: LCP family protein [Chloroflexota bacterium]
MTRGSRPQRQHARPTASARRAMEASRATSETAEWEIPAQGGRARGRRRTPIKRIALTILLVVLIGLVGGGILLWGRMSAFNDEVSTAPAASTALFGKLNGSDRVNIAMFGYSGAEREGAFLADSIQILSIDPTTDQTTTIPIPRDVWVEGFAPLPNNAKVNEAFADGYNADGTIENAGELSSAALEYVTGLHIDGWLAMEFQGFQAMVDAVGGVTVENPRTFSYTWDEPSYLAGDWNGGSFEAGTLQLDGAQALDYSRVRYASIPEEASDYARSIRQGQVLAALRTKLGEGGLGSLGPGLQLMDAMKSRLKTNLSAIDLALLSGHLASDRRIELSEGVILQATTNTIGQYVLVVLGQASSTDYAPLHHYIADELARPIPNASPAPAAAAQ